jgi:hypothetical protein
MRILLLLCFAVATGLANAAIAGFESLRWDMPLQEVQRSNPNFEEWPEQDFDLTSGKKVTQQRYGLRTFIAAGCTFSLKLEFMENQLSQVILSQHLTDETQCRPALLTELTNRYGSRPVIKSDLGVETFKWEISDASIVLRVDRLSNQREVTAVIYTSKATIDRLLRPKRL